MLTSSSVDWLNSNPSNTHTLPVRYSRIIHVIVVVGLILSIVGGTNTNITPSGAESDVPVTSKAGIILYLGAYVAIALVCLICLSKTLPLTGEGRRISIGVAVAMPLILARLIYSVLVVFVHSKDFRLIGGSIGALVGMDVVEEFLIVFIFLFLGLTLSKVDQAAPGSQGSASELRPMKIVGGRRERRGTDPAYGVV